MLSNWSVPKLYEAGSFFVRNRGKLLSKADSSRPGMVLSSCGLSQNPLRRGASPGYKESMLVAEVEPLS